MRICFWKDGGSENESNQVVILAINLRLRNRCSERVKVDQKRSERFPGKRWKNQVAYTVFTTHQNTLCDLQNRRVAGFPVTDGFDPIRFRRLFSIHQGLTGPVSE
jgi:hypothetical protein